MESTEPNPPPQSRLVQPSVLIFINRPAGGPRRLTLSEKDLRLLLQLVHWGGYRGHVINIDDDVDRINDAVVLLRPTVIINLVEHMFGETHQVSAVAGMLDLFGYVYTGSGPEALSACHHRTHAGALLLAAGLPVAAMGGGGGARRLSVSLLGNDEVECLPVIEILGNKTRPRSLKSSNATTKLSAELCHLALLAWKVVGLRDVGQVVFSLSASGKLQIESVIALVDLLGPVFRAAADASELGFPSTIVKLCKLCHARLDSEELAISPIP